MIVNTSLNTFKYFSSLYPEIINDTILDYGSNYGRFLDSSNNTFIQKNYTGIDVDLSAIQFGREKFPMAEFIHYDSFNYMYNPIGIENLPLPIKNTYDTIISYSVFTHTTEEDFLIKLEQLFTLVKYGGKILFTFCDPSDQVTVDFFTQKRMSIFGKCDIISTSTRLYLVDADIKDIPDPNKMLITFYNSDYLQDLLAKYQISIHKAPKECRGCFQSCVILQKPT